jgi:hypothetical protein
MVRHKLKFREKNKAMVKHSPPNESLRIIEICNSSLRPVYTLAILVRFLMRFFSSDA